jgi:hypothetical protein
MVCNTRVGLGETTVPDLLSTNSSTKDALLTLAKRRFGADITPAEEKLFRAAASGQPADFLNTTTQEPSGKQQEDRKIRGDRIAWLLTNPAASALVSAYGVRIYGAIVAGDVDLSYVRIRFPLTVATSVLEKLFLGNSSLEALSLRLSQFDSLDATALSVDGDVSFLGVKVSGDCHFEGAAIRGTVDCSEGAFASSLGFDSARIGQDLLLDACEIRRAVNLTGITVAGDLRLSHGKFAEILGNSAQIAGNVLLIQSRANGTVQLSNAQIRKSLRCDETSLYIEDATRSTLDVRDATINGDVFLANGFHSAGEVDLTGATIDRNLVLSSGTFLNPSGYALEADSVRIKGSVLLTRDFRATGTVDFKNAIVTNRLIVRGIQRIPKFALDLRLAKVGTLLNAKDSWPTDGNLFLQGFKYDVIDFNAPLTANDQVKWLRRDREAIFSSQPYQQLANVFTSMGMDQEAVKVLILKNHDTGKHLSGPVKWFWYDLIGPVIGYGYLPWNALALSLVVIGMGAGLFHVGYHRYKIQPTSDNAYFPGTSNLRVTYQKFNPVIYSLETFIPVLTLGMKANWAPAAKAGGEHRIFGLFAFKTGALFRGYLWGHTVTGWVLTTTWVAGFTGLLKV